MELIGLNQVMSTPNGTVGMGFHAGTYDSGILVQMIWFSHYIGMVQQVFRWFRWSGSPDWYKQCSWWWFKMMLLSDGSGYISPYVYTKELSIMMELFGQNFTMDKCWCCW